MISMFSSLFLGVALLIVAFVELDMVLSRKIRNVYFGMFLFGLGLLSFVVGIIIVSAPLFNIMMILLIGSRGL